MRVTASLEERSERVKRRARSPRTAAQLLIDGALRQLALRVLHLCGFTPDERCAVAPERQERFHNGLKIIERVGKHRVLGDRRRDLARLAVDFALQPSA